MRTMGITMDCARPTEFMMAVERMEAEHSMLTEQLTDLYLTAKTISSADQDQLAVWLKRLALQSAQLEQQVEEHLLWSGKELFPMVGLYAGDQTQPSIGHSYWGLNKSLELVRRDLVAFRAEPVHDALVMSKETAEEAVSFLLQACVALSDFLKTEKDMLFPLAEEMLTDIDYLFS
ncbi:hypothetical protein [Gorillibacterium massiliense]|uniref:hypothetical protein n=1 Tax=Gorillibacterium massiliense TaxID=1280390 RepID=UPI000595125D|nr:hypothetical protein [Gorillibacterium massiliense]